MKALVALAVFAAGTVAWALIVAAAVKALDRPSEVALLAGLPGGAIAAVVAGGVHSRFSR